jgi:hypothetical protein
MRIRHCSAAEQLLIGGLPMKSLVAAIGAGVVAIAVLGQPANAAPRCAWEGHHWRCWNGHSWYRDHHWHRGDHAWYRDHHWRSGRDMYYGNSAPRGHRMHERDRVDQDMRYGR